MRVDSLQCGLTFWPRRRKIRCSIRAARTVALAAIFSVMEPPKSFLSILVGGAAAVLPDLAGRRRPTGECGRLWV